MNIPKYNRHASNFKGLPGNQDVFKNKVLLMLEEGEGGGGGLEGFSFLGTN
jgi:hypothetical protein